MNKRKFRMDWKRSLVITLVVALMLGTLSFTGSDPKAQASEYSKIVSVSPYVSDLNGLGINYEFKMDDGRSMHLNLDQKNVAQVYESGKKKIRSYTGGSVIYITNSGELFQGSPPTKKLDGVADFEATTIPDTFSNFSSYFALMQDGTVMAWGRGTEGQLGIGSKINKTVPTEVVDPLTGDPLTGIKKIYSLAIDSVLLVTDGKVYIIGSGFGNNSRTGAKPLDISAKFASFSNASEFEMKALENLNYSLDYNHKYNDSFVSLYEASRRVFIIKGQSYSLTNFNDYDYRESAYGKGEANYKSSLVPFPSNTKIENLRKITSAVNKNSSNDKNVSTGYLNLDENGNLEYWGTPLSGWNYSPASFSATRNQVATNVNKVWASGSGTIIFSKPNGYLYGWGTNADNMFGTSDRNPSTPIRLSGASNEIKDVKDFAMAASNSRMFVLQNDNSVLTWRSNGAISKLPQKYLSLLTLRPKESMSTVAYAINENGQFGYFDANATFNLVTGAPTVYPEDYVVPVTAPDKPILAISSQDKFNQSIVSINYGTTNDIATKQYEINGGGWQNYSGDILITQSGSVTIKARSADSKGNMSEIGELTLTSNPIVITAGDPRIEKLTADEFKIHASTTGSAKVQVRVDGAAWQDFNIANNLLLTPGNHTIEVRLLNDRDQELINKSFNVTADDPTPVVVGKPVLTQKGLNNNYGLDIDVAYDTAAGIAEYSVDGGPWNTFTGTITVSNAAHTIRAKVVNQNHIESEVVDFVTTVVPPKITVNNDQVTVDLGIDTSDVTVHYKDSNNQWVQYSGPITYVPGTHNIEIEIRDNVGTPVFNGGPYTVTIVDPNAGNPGGGTTPTPNPDAGTPVGEEDVEFTVHSGGLSGRFEGADLSTIIIDSTNPYQTINSVSRVILEDSRGSGEPYQYSMDVTDFVSDPITDNSTNQQNLVVSIPANSLSVKVLATKTLNGPTAELSNIGKHVFTGTGPETLASAKAFEGMGRFEIPMEFTLSVPDRVKIISSGSSSKFVPGESTGLMAAIYRSQIRTTLTSGI